MSRRVGVFGGSFDPVHRAHVLVAQRARDQVELDEVWLLPAQRAPHKGAAPAAAGNHRLEMCRLAIAATPGIDVCRLELDRPAGRRSVETLEELQRLHPDVEFRFVMGEDSFRGLEQWYEPERLARMAPFVVQPRPEFGGDRVQRFGGAPVVWLEGEELDLSSSSIRAALAAGTVPDAVPPEVGEYIRRHRLYVPRSAEKHR